jgi:Family of unknown function (DUF6084)
VSAPQLEFWVLEAAPVPHAAVPTLAFRLRARDRSEREVYTVALSTQIHIEAAQRPHDARTRERLLELFGEPERWGDTARGVLWTRQELLLPSFTGSVTHDLHVPLSSDAELASFKYFNALRDGEIPLSFHFSGTVFYAGEGDRLQLTQVSWSAEAQFRLPLETWRRTLEEHHPPGGYVHLSDETLEALRVLREERGYMSLDAVVADLTMGARA